MGPVTRTTQTRKTPAARAAALGLAALLLWTAQGLAGTPAGAGPSDTGLKGAVDEILTDPRLDGAAAGVVVADAATGATLYRRDGDDRLVPASNTKIPTSAAAMEVLGPDHRFRTEVLATGRLVSGVLHGDLYLRGTGDPTVLAADYDRLAARVAAAGVRRVTGRLVADDTRFDANRLGRSWAADDESSYYSAQISALTLAPDTDYDSGTVIVEASAAEVPGRRPAVTLIPRNDHVRVDNRATTVGAAARARSPSSAPTAPTPSWSAAGSPSEPPPSGSGSPSTTRPGTRRPSSRTRWPPAGCGSRAPPGSG